MTAVRFSVVQAAALACVLALGTRPLAASEVPAQASILERLVALEQKFEQLAAENQMLREKLAAAQPPPSSATPLNSTAAPPPVTPSPPTAKPAAVYVAAAGKEDKLTLGGFFHINGETGGAPDARWTGINDRFLVRRARLNLAGSFAQDFSFKLEGDFGNNSIGGRSGYSAQMTDGFVTWTPSSVASVRAGQFKTPFGFEQLMSDTRTQTVERSLPNDRLTASRQIGAGMFGEIVPQRLHYSVGVFNGNGVNNGANDNDDFLWAGRLNGTMLKGGAGSSTFQLDGGINAFTSKTPGTTTRREGLGADLQFTWGRATLMGEWLANDLTASSGATSTSEGWSLLGSWMIHKQWSLVARYETFDLSTTLPATTTDTWTLGGTYYIHGDNLKFTLNYLQGSIDGTGTDSRILGRLQLAY